MWGATVSRLSGHTSPFSRDVAGGSASVIPTRLSVGEGAPGPGVT